MVLGIVSDRVISKLDNMGVIMILWGLVLGVCPLMSFVTFHKSSLVSLMNR